MIRSVLSFVVAAAIAMHASGAPSAAELPTITLSINGQKITAEVARTAEETEKGLMNRFSLRPDHGMLFVFDRSEPRAFWMKNTFIPLSIAFITPDGRIVNIDDMAPQDETLHWSRGPAMYVIEMRKGWFAERGIRAGDRVTGLPPPSP
jgi:uncharacterized protein